MSRRPGLLAADRRPRLDGSFRRVTGRRRVARHRRVAGRDRISGQSLVEYLILGALIGLVLVIGEPSPLESLVRAMQQAYGRYVMALSLP